MTAYLSACLRDTAAQEFLSFRLRRRLFGFPHQLGHHLAGALHQLRSSRFFGFGVTPKAGLRWAHREVPLSRHGGRLRLTATEEARYG